jgi:hypothetical protein
VIIGIHNLTVPFFFSHRGYILKFSLSKFNTALTRNRLVRLLSIAGSEQCLQKNTEYLMATSQVKISLFILLKGSN